MATVTMQQVRVEIGDQPRWCAAPGMREILTPNSDGTTADYHLRFQKALLGSLRVWFGTTPAGGGVPGWLEIRADDAVYGWTAALDANGWPVVTFALNPPPAKIIGTRYQTVAFSDDDLAVYIAGVVGIADPLLALRQIHYNIIPVLLNDQERLTVISIGQRREDMTAWIQAQKDMRASIGAELQQPPETGVAVAFGSGYGW